MEVPDYMPDWYVQREHTAEQVAKFQAEHFERCGIAASEELARQQLACLDRIYVLFTTEDFSALHETAAILEALDNGGELDYDHTTTTHHDSGGATGTADRAFEEDDGPEAILRPGDRAPAAWFHREAG